MSEPAHDTLRTVARSLADAAAGAGGITFLSPAGVPTRWSYGELYRCALEVATALRVRGLAGGDRVALLLPSEPEFVATFLGVILAGGAGVPLAPPAALRRVGGYLEGCARQLNAAGARFLVTSRNIRPLLGTLTTGVPSLHAILTPGDLRHPVLAAPADVTLDDMAMVQFTSGSTAAPKGVVLTHGNLAANCRAITCSGLDVRPDDRAVSWLPLFHDMGLIGFVLAPIYAGIATTLMPPLCFLRRPASWLEALTAHGGTMTYAPNFGYALAARRVGDDELRNVDLSAVRVAGCGAEPISAETLRAFARRFARVGFRDEAFRPSYGMAESTLAVSFAEGLATDRVHRDALAGRRVARPAPPDAPDVVEVVCCGRPFEGHRLEIVEQGTGATLPERRVGEIRIQGPSVTRTYLTASGRLAAQDPEGWLRTGDLGYLAGGRLFVCGRIKDLIIVRGRNYAPQDLEWAAARVEGIRAGCVAAFGVPGTDGGERVVVVAEVGEQADRTGLADRVRGQVAADVGVAVESVVLVPPRTVPKTSSGKLQRSLLRERFLSGTLLPAVDESMLVTAGRLLASQWHFARTAVRGPGSG